MFLCHFPSPWLTPLRAWVLPSALPGGARTFLPDEIGAIARSAGPCSVYQPYESRRPVQGLVGKLVCPLIDGPRYRFHVEPLK